MLPPEDTVQAFATAQRFLGGNISVVADGVRLADAVDEIVRRQEGPRRVLYDPFPLADELGLPMAMSARGTRLVPIEGAGDAADYRVGLTAAPLAAAQSGSLLVGGRPGGWGIVSVLPWVHIAVLRASDIMPDMAGAFGAMLERFEAGERDWVWITGPSRTADIAKTLVMGIHGPNTLEVLILDDRAGSGAGG